MTVMTTGANPTASVLGVAAATSQPSADGSAAFAQALSSAAGLAADATSVAQGDPASVTPGVVAAVSVASTPGAAPAQSVAEVASVSDPLPNAISSSGATAPASEPSASLPAATTADVPTPKHHDRDADPAADFATGAVTVANQTAALSAVPIVASTQSPTPVVPNKMEQTTSPNATVQFVTSPTSMRLSTTVAQAPEATPAPSTTAFTTALTNATDTPPSTATESSSPAHALPGQSTDNGTMPLASAGTSVVDDHLLASVVSVTMSTGDPIELTAQVGATVEKQAKQGSSDATAVNGRVDVKLGVADKSAAHEAAIAGQSLDDTAVQSTLVRTVPEKSLSDSGKPETSSAETAADTSPATTPTISGHVRAQHTSETHVATSAFTPAATGPSTSTDATEVAHQIGRHIASTRLSGLARDRPMHLSVLLHPEDLGEVSVQLTLVAGRIDVQVSSQSDTTRDMLRQGMQDLRRQLSDSGVAVGDTDVHDGWSQQQNSSQNDQRTADQRSSQQPRLPGLPAPSSSRMTTPEPTLVHRPSRTGLDILA